MLSHSSRMGVTVRTFFRTSCFVQNSNLYQNVMSYNLKGRKSFSCVSSHSLDCGSGHKVKTKRTANKLLSSDVIYVSGDSAAVNENATVTRLKASQLHKVNKPSLTSIRHSSTLEINDANTTIKPYSPDFINEGLHSNTSHNEELPNESSVLLHDRLADIPGDEFSSKIEGVPGINFTKSEAKKMAANAKHSKDLKQLEEIRWRGRNQSFNYSLAAFISVCMYCGHSESAIRTFDHYVKLSDKKFSKKVKLISINSYNEMLKGLASMGNQEKMREVVNRLKKTELIPNVHTFAHILTCLGKEVESETSKTEIQDTLQWMSQQKINIEEVFLSGRFPGDCLEHCFAAVQKVIPEAEQKCFMYKNRENFLGINRYENLLVDVLNSSFFTDESDSPSMAVLTATELKDKLEKQIENEVRGSIEIRSIYEKSHSSNASNKRDGLMEQWEQHWRKSFHSSLVAQKEFMKKNFEKKNKGVDFYPYFIALGDEDIVNLMLAEIRKLGMGSTYYTPTFSTLSYDLGNEFYDRFLIKYKQKTHFMTSLRDVYEEYCMWYLQRSDPDASYIPRIEWNQIVQRHIERGNLRDMPPEWPYTLKASIGKLLYNIILSRVVIWKENETPSEAFPAFYKIHRTQDLKVRDEVKQSPLLVEVFSGTYMKTLTFQSNSMPMVSPPVPWTSIHSGGYFVAKSDFVRVVQHAHLQKTRMIEGGMVKLFPVMDSLNQLASTPWIINVPVLDLIIELFNGEGWEKMDVCAHPSMIPEPQPISSDLPQAEKKKRFKLLTEFKKKKNEMNSLWHNMLYKLSIANYYRDEVIWLPQNMDFRGRTYPVPPHLTPLSSDVFRSIMNFAEGKRLGKEGLFWLKLHIVNLTGLKKRCGVAERMEFYDQVADEIIDSAERPLEGRRWWTQSDEPWQTLAACKELTSALRSGRPEDFISHLPIHQDGSCNGLQHYAALGRDKGGARSVNLCPSPSPQDVYSDVVELVEETRQKDAAEGLQVARDLEGFVKRKVIKQTIMTNVYGVTRFGARLQIMKQLNYLDEFPTKSLFTASLYLTAQTFGCLGAIFSATKQIQDWLSKIAVGISKNCMQNVEWVTPLGFPVVQPYNKSVNNPIVPGKVIHTFNSDGFLKPNVMKQKNAFPPNFIHSLDSSHMMLTSLFCQRELVTFVSIHDCFWTHAATVHIMNKICREQFVALHSQPILEDLAMFLSAKYSVHSNYDMKYTVHKKSDSGFSANSEASLKTLLGNIPPKGEFDLNQVLDSVFFFS